MKLEEKPELTDCYPCYIAGVPVLIVHKFASQLQNVDSNKEVDIIRSMSPLTKHCDLPNTRQSFILTVPNRHY